MITEKRNENEIVSYSFHASLVLSPEEVRESYFDVKNAFRSYRGTSVKIDFACESLYAGNVFFGAFEYMDGKLCLFTTYSPNSHEANEFALHETRGENSEQTPTFMVLGDPGQSKNASRLIAHFMKFKSKTKNTQFKPEYAEDLRIATFDELLDAGFIIIDEEKPENPELPEIDENAPEELPDEEEEEFDIESVSDLEADSDYAKILNELKIDSGVFEYKKNYFLRAIDEEWVNQVEHIIPIIYKLINNPRSGLEEREEVVQASLARKVTTRSVVHLTQHMDMVSEIKPDGDVVPAKLLNVFVDETLKTYENRFLNTLILRLFVFVNRRYEIVKKEMADELRTEINVAENFNIPDTNAKGKIYLHMELSQPPEGLVVLKNRTFTTDLWHRVEALNGMCVAMMNSPFCKELGKSYVRPPIMRTNAILKNKNFYQCLLCWQFVEGYENAGYEMLIQSDLVKPGKAFMQKTCKTLADSYSDFLKQMNAKSGNRPLDSIFSDSVISPKLKDSFGQDDKEDYDIEWSASEGFHPQPKPRKYRTRKLTAYEKTVVDAVMVALEADEKIRKHLPPPDVEAIENEANDE